MFDKVFPVFTLCVLLSYVNCRTVPTETSDIEQTIFGSDPSDLKDVSGNIISPPVGHVDEDKNSDDVLSKDLLAREGSNQVDRSKRDLRTRLRNYFRSLFREDNGDVRNGTRVIHSYRKDGRIGNFGHYSFSVQASVHDHNESAPSSNNLPTVESDHGHVQ